jgi:hypothetical protein
MPQAYSVDISCRLAGDSNLHGSNQAVSLPIVSWSDMFRTNTSTCNRLVQPRLPASIAARIERKRSAMKI